MALPDRENGSFSSSSSVHRTDPPSLPPSDGPTFVRSVVRSDYLTLWEEGGSVRPSEGGRRGEGIIMPCDYCGEAEVGHECQMSWRWLEPIPLDTDHLAHYLANTWGIRNAELVAIESSSYAIRDALLIIWRGGKDGRRYENPAGLIVKLARRITNASERARRRQR